MGESSRKKDSITVNLKILMVIKYYISNLNPDGFYVWNNLASCELIKILIFI